jgi:Mn2+/Fe2+ NRAMP family transporter
MPKADWFGYNATNASIRWTLVVPPTPPSPLAVPTEPGRDRLTIARLMVLTAGVAIGLTLFRENKSIDLASVDWWRATVTAALIGCSLPGAFYTTHWRQPGGQAGLGSLLWLALSLGGLLMIPPVVGATFVHSNELGSNSAGMCLYYTMPLASLWFVLAAAMGGRLASGSTASEPRWSNWFGWRLGLLWSALGLWLLVDFYREAFF